MNVFKNGFQIFPGKLCLGAYEKQLSELILNESTMHLCTMQIFLKCSPHFQMLLKTIYKKQLKKQILRKLFSVRRLPNVYSVLENCFQE